MTVEAATIVPDSEQACIEMLYAARWPEGFRCPRCGYADYAVISSRRLPLYVCLSCRYQCSVTAGTVMERSRVPLRKWFQAIDIMARTGMNATRLSKMIGVTYKTAWLMMHKLRDAMARRNDAELLSGLVRFGIGIAGKQTIPSLDGLHPTESPFIIGGTVDAAGHVRRAAVVLDHGGDTYQKRITAQGARRFVERCVDLNRAVVDLPVNSRGLSEAPELRKIADRIIWRTSRYYGVWRKNLTHYLQEEVYRTNNQLAGLPPFQSLLSLAASSAAPTAKAIAARPTPGRPDWYWHPGFYLDRMLAELQAYASGWLARSAASA